MNILFLTTHVNTGGITSYIRTVSHQLISRGHQVHIISSGGELADDLRSLGARVVEYPFRTKSELSPKVYAALPFLVRYCIRERIDIIHAHTRITQVMALWVSMVTKRSYVTTCHGFFRPRFFRRVFGCWGAKVIAISAPVVAHLRDDLKVPQKNIVLVESGIDVGLFPVVTLAERSEKRHQYRIAPDALVIGTIGRLSDVKGHDILVRALARVHEALPRVQLLLVGKGKEEGALRALVASLGLVEAVSFCPIVNQTVDILPLFDVFAMPSRQEGLGLSVMEAQAVGIPVVASAVGGLTSVIADGTTGLLVPPEDPHALAAALIRMLTDRQLADSVTRAARDFVVSHCSAVTMVDKLETVYTGVVKGCV